MIDSRMLQKKILADGRVNSKELELLKSVLYEQGKIGKPEVEFLVQLHRRVERVSPAFEQFFYVAVKQHVLIDKSIDPNEVAWLRSIIFEDGKVTSRDVTLLRELRGEASTTCPEFDELFAECCPK